MFSLGFSVFDLTPIIDPKDVLVFRLFKFGSSLPEKRLAPGFQVNCVVDFRCNQFASLRYSSALLQLKQPALVKAFLPKSPVETLDERVVGRLARATELKLYFSSVGPFVKSFRGEFGAIVNLYHLRQSLRLF